MKPSLIFFVPAATPLCSLSSRSLSLAKRKLPVLEPPKRASFSSASKGKMEGGEKASRCVPHRLPPYPALLLTCLAEQSCETREYVQHEQSQVVNTAFAIIGLLAAKSANHGAIRRGCRLLMNRQLKSGEWAQEAIEGGKCAQGGQ